MVRAAQLAEPHVQGHLAALEAGAHAVAARPRLLALLPAAGRLAVAGALAAADALALAVAALGGTQLVQPGRLCRSVSHRSPPPSRARTRAGACPGARASPRAPSAS